MEKYSTAQSYGCTRVWIATPESRGASQSRSGQADDARCRCGVGGQAGLRNGQRRNGRRLARKKIFRARAPRAGIAGELRDALSIADIARHTREPDKRCGMIEARRLEDHANAGADVLTAHASTSAAGVQAEKPFVRREGCMSDEEVALWRVRAFCTER